jgi:hypothetical protein
VPEAALFENYVISIGYVAPQLQTLEGLPNFVIFAENMPIFVSIFRLLGCQYERDARTSDGSGDWPRGFKHYIWGSDGELILICTRLRILAEMRGRREDDRKK